MLFDLRAPGRKRLIQGIYLVLAVVLVGGTVLFGVGTGLPGLFSGGNNSGSSVDLEKQQRERIAQVERKISANPQDAQALATLASLQYASAVSKMPENVVAATPEVKAGLKKVVVTWERYLATEPKRIDPALANKMVGVFGPDSLNRPNEWADVQGLLTQQAVAEAKARGEDPPVNAYLQLLAAQTAAKRTRQAKLTEQAVRDAASPSQKKQIDEAIKMAKDPEAQTAAGQAQAAQTPQTVTVPED